MRLVIHSSYISRKLSFYQSFQIQCSIHQSAGQAIAVLSPFFPSIYSSFHPSNSTINLFISYLFIFPSNLTPSTSSSTHPHIRLSCYSFIRQSILFFIYLSIYPNIHSSIHSFVHSSTISSVILPVNELYIFIN